MKNLNLITLVSFIFASKVSADCFATKLGYPCCSIGYPSILTDKDGDWSVENGQWCGIPSNDGDCWSIKFGYPCCITSSEALVTDDNGQWGSENGQWCGIVNRENSSQYANDGDNNDEIVDMAEYAKSYMNKLNITANCPDVAFYEQEGISYGTLQRITYYSENTKSNRPMNILLPPNYNPEKKYPILYLLHGILSDQNSLIKSKYGTPNIAGYLMNKGMAKEMIIAYPYTYAPKDGIEVEPGFTKEHAAGYDNFINELLFNIMPYMEKNYPILTGRDNTAIAGFSMGGRNSLYIGYSKPELFGYIGAFSPAPGVLPDEKNDGLLTMETFQIKDKQFTPYVTLICTGTEDTVVAEYPSTYHNALNENHQAHIWYEVPSGGHDGITVSSGFYNYMQTLFGKLNEDWIVSTPKREEHRGPIAFFIHYFSYHYKYDIIFR
ncbi:alpha/beta-hydrolase [Neocallimastix lanati (nom. inval.)]|nr:alpha/beta-hydrolase [Neocallimastix sp. JGI-2020a]